MCLGVPGKIIKIEGVGALVDFWGARRWIRLDTIDEEVTPGDYVLAHVGFAIKKIPPSEIEATLDMYSSLLGDKDLMGTDVRDEIKATSEDQ